MNCATHLVAMNRHISRRYTDRYPRVQESPYSCCMLPNSPQSCLPSGGGGGFLLFFFFFFFSFFLFSLSNPSSIILVCSPPLPFVYRSFLLVSFCFFLSLDSWFSKCYIVYQAFSFYNHIVILYNAIWSSLRIVVFLTLSTSPSIMIAIIELMQRRWVRP
jgi:hypothetical protein